MNLLGASLVVVLFALLVHVLRLVPRAKEAIVVSRASVDVMRDSALDDDVKEKALQKGAVRLLYLSFVLLTGSTVALAAPLGVIWLLDLLGLLSLETVTATLLRWDFILFATVVGVAAYIFFERRRR